MAIKDEDLHYEKRNLQETNEWLEGKIKNKEEEHLQLEKKVAMLRKESGGSYSHQLETAINQHHISSNILNGYK